jgi:tRNA-dihydrouridine synthase A
MNNPTPQPSGPWRLCVAPMMDWTDRHCRYFHRLLAPRARLYTEMVVAQAAIYGDRQRLLGFDAAEHPLALQLGGSDPRLLAQAAAIGAEFGYDEINLNCGCPSDRVQAGRFGACLMTEPNLVAEGVGAMRDALPATIPVTVKCRLGVDDDDDEPFFRRFVDTVASAGCEVFIVHARKAWLKGLSPKENREIPPLDYERVFRLKRDRPALTVVLNGGLMDQAAIDAALDVVDGVMLGRLAYHEPYHLAQIHAALFGAAPIAREAAVAALRPYMAAHIARGGELKHIARHILGLYQGQPGARQFRRELSTSRPGQGLASLDRAMAAVASLPSAA